MVDVWRLKLQSITLVVDASEGIWYQTHSLIQRMETRAEGYSEDTLRRIQ
jgi:hypothetical protein